MRIDQLFKGDVTENKMVSVFEPVTNQTFTDMMQWSDNKFLDERFGQILWLWVDSPLKRYIAPDAFLKIYDSIFESASFTYENIINICKLLWGESINIQFDFSVPPAVIKFTIYTTNSDIQMWIDENYENIIDDNDDELAFLFYGQFIAMTNVLSLLRKMCPQGWFVTANIQIIL